MTQVIAEPCVDINCVDIKDRACIEECPDESISFEDDLPGQFSNYKEINAAFFGDLGSPGGAAKVGMTENDPIAVRSLVRPAPHGG